MHPDICTFTSELYYEGRLGPRPGLENQAILLDGPFGGTGLRYVPIEDVGNQSSSPEEADRQLRSMGFEPVPQVGVSGFRIDIGVRHPSWPHGFVLGVECDGAAYHSSRPARDRDRLREQVLRDLGWELHRIWSTDWFTDSIKEGARLRKAIEDRLDFLKTQEVTAVV